MDASEIVLTAEGRQKLMEELAWREGDNEQGDHRAHQGSARLWRPFRELRVRCR